MDNSAQVEIWRGGLADRFSLGDRMSGCAMPGTGERVPVEVSLISGECWPCEGRGPAIAAWSAGQVLVLATVSPWVHCAFASAPGRCGATLESTSAVT
eukprot:2068845-Pleurochrysis_carterae.AAC.1